jgi:hypothetical protein
MSSLLYILGGIGCFGLRSLTLAVAKKIEEEGD